MTAGARARLDPAYRSMVAARFRMRQRWHGPPGRARAAAGATSSRSTSGSHPLGESATQASSAWRCAATSSRSSSTIPAQPPPRRSGAWSSSASGTSSRPPANTSGSATRSRATYPLGQGARHLRLDARQDARPAPIGLHATRRAREVDARIRAAARNRRCAFRGLEHRSLKRSGEGSGSSSAACRSSTSAARSSASAAPAATSRPASRPETDRDRLELQMRQAPKLQALGTFAGGVAREVQQPGRDPPGTRRWRAATRRCRPPREHHDRSREGRLRCARPGPATAGGHAASRAGIARIPLAPLVRGCHYGCSRPRCPERVARLRAAPEHDLYVACDPAQIRQVLLNLRPERHTGHAELGARSRSRSASLLADGDATAAHLRPGRYARIRFADQGCGMDEAAAGARIFEPFFTTKPPSEAPASACRWSTASCTATPARWWPQPAGAGLELRRLPAARGGVRDARRRATRDRQGRRIARPRRDSDRDDRRVVDEQAGAPRPPARRAGSCRIRRVVARRAISVERSTTKRARPTRAPLVCASASGTSAASWNARPSSTASSIAITAPWPVGQQRMCRIAEHRSATARSASALRAHNAPEQVPLRHRRDDLADPRMPVLELVGELLDLRRDAPAFLFAAGRSAKATGSTGLPPRRIAVDHVAGTDPHLRRRIQRLLRHEVPSARGRAIEQTGEALPRRRTASGARAERTPSAPITACARFHSPLSKRTRTPASLPGRRKRCD